MMWSTHDFLVHLFIYKIFAGSSYFISFLCKGITLKLIKISTLLLGIVGKLSTSTF
ncbi:hypothetical protein O3M35_004909 [Rhynocoris fuscipes]|uniref:Uncharacterized protein n=1 Tax=Rhynocoris fuscipes TaxID=488301 RepID=A0AAW1DG65_9HEMI